MIVDRIIIRTPLEYDFGPAPDVWVLCLLEIIGVVWVCVVGVVGVVVVVVMMDIGVVECGHLYCRSMLLSEQS